ncbi:DUF6897 domain-containing protein [Spirochaeta cellobiosiphila]|uniref:DUF6897 domain-containing protein n=1 Tax=Spirochaeta cellobiosiphila TaxID=504483 RepID=UPI001B7FC9BC|nr:hypothetical protein [Spirochaeta cellobiosiphila]
MINRVPRATMENKGEQMLDNLINRKISVYSVSIDFFFGPTRGVLLSVNDKWLTLKKGRETFFIAVDKIIQVKAVD